MGAGGVKSVVASIVTRGGALKESLLVKNTNKGGRQPGRWWPEWSKNPFFRVSWPYFAAVNSDEWVTFVAK